jgi:hypothetical protein
MSRFYTAARRHPWVLGKVADWRIPLGPYTPAQIAVAVAGGFVLVKTIPLWSWMGPIPPAAWLLGIWAVRRPKIKGRSPFPAALGWLLLLWQPRGGRIGGRAARDRYSRPLLGGFTIEGAPALTAAASPSRPGVQRVPRATRPGPSAGRSSTRRPARSAAPATPARPVSGVQQLLARAGQGGGVR